MFDSILNKAPVFLLVAGRCFGLIFTLPLFSMRTVSNVAKIALGGYMAYFLMSYANFYSYGSAILGDGAFSLYFIFLLIGEVLIGIILGFFVSIIFAASTATGLVPFSATSFTFAM